MSGEPGAPPPAENRPPAPRPAPPRPRRRRRKAKPRPAQPPPAKAKQRPRPPTHPRRDRPTGQIPKLTPEVQKAICDVIASTALTFEDACHLAGIKPTTGREWLQRGNGEHKSRRIEPRYASFAEAVARARARDKAARVARMTQAAIGGFEVARETITRPDGTKIERVRKQPPDWRADESVLERRYPEEFGRRMKIEHEGGAPLVDWAGMVEEAWAKIRADAAKRVGASSSAAPALLAHNDSRNNGEPP